MKGALIAIEGIDGTGKNTQATMLVEYIKSIKYKVKKFEFPNYSKTFFGKEVGHYLNGDFGGLNQIHPKLVSLLYAGDRFESQKEIMEYLENGYFVICDRYVSSNIAHQSVKLPQDELSSFLNWVEEMEYGIFDLPRPDHTILLDLHPTIAQEMVLKKEKRSYTEHKQDIHEKDKSYLLKVYEVYNILLNQDNWSTIPCQLDNYMRTPQDIFSDIKNLLHNKFNDLMERMDTV